MEYIYLICPIVALLTCQILKCLIELVETKKFSLARLTNGSGGMPSSHTSFTTSITMLIGFKLGFTSPLFAACFVFTGIVVYDAMGLRYESGKHAEAINQLNKKNKIKCDDLKQEIGHKPMEVLVGLVYGTLIAYLFSLI